MTRARWEEPAVFAAATAALFGVALLPLVFLAAEAVGSMADAMELLTSRNLWTLLGKTLVRSASVSAITTLLGVPLGFLLARTDVAGRRPALVLHAFPMFLPPFLLALGWFHLFGRSGLLGTPSSAALLFSPFGLVAILALTFTPVVSTLTALALQGVDPAIEEAGRVVASRWRVATRILLPIAWPSASLGALVVFALSLSELAVPMFLRVEAYPAAVFARLGGIAYSPGEAFVLALPLVAVALGLVAVERAFIGRRPFTVLGRRRPHEPMPLGRWRRGATAGVWLVVGASLMPFLALFARAAGGGFLAIGGWIGTSVQNSLFAGCLGATALTALGLPLGYALARQRRGASLVDGTAFLAFVTPAAVLGVGLIAVWNRPSTLAVYGSAAILVLGYLGRYAVLAARPMAIAIGQRSAHIEEAAAAAGVRFTRRLLTLTLPLHGRAFLGTWLLCLVFCLRDTETAVLFYPPGGETLPIRIFTLEANGPASVVAALALVHASMTAAVVAVGLALLRRARS